MVVSDSGETEYVNSHREARELVREFSEQGHYAYVRDLGPELAYLMAS